MPAGTSRFRYLVYSISVCLLLCVASNTRIQAQKTPPILKDGESSAFDPKRITDLQTTATSGNTDAAKLARNRLIAITVEQVDTAFNDYRKKSRKSTDRLNFLFDFLEIGASSAISIVKGGLRAKSLIGEGLSLFQGSRSAFNKDFRFLEKQILFDKMVAKRSDKLTAIYAKLNQNTTQYPWEQARSELRDYFFAGTIDEALSSLSRETGAQAQTAEKNLIDAKTRLGIVGAVPIEVLQAGLANAKILSAVLDKYAAEDKIIKASDKKIKDATKTIADEQKKPTAQQNQTTITDAQGVIQTATQASQGATTERDKAFEKVKSIYRAVDANPALSKVLEEIPRKYDREPQLKAFAEASLGRLKAKDLNQPATFEDYAFILQNLNKVISDKLPEDPSLNTQLKNILDNIP